MSNKAKTATMQNDAKAALMPKLRFPEFRGEAEWEATQLQKIAHPVIDRAVTGDGDNVLSLSGEHGLVLQSDYFGKKIAGDSAERYLKLLRNDFVYNDRTTKASTFGTIKRLSKYSGGIVSPIYKCFRFHSNENPIFWEWYFESGSHDAALGGLVNEGARAGRFNISITQFLSTSAWRPEEPEQQKIADCLTSLDELIAAQARKVDALKTHKKGLMQQLFPREGETQPRLRFPEFQGAGEWVAKPLEAIAPLQRGFDLTSDEMRPGNVPIVYSNGPKGFHEKGMAKGPGIVTGRSGTIGKIHFVESGEYWPHNTSLWVTSFKGHAPKFVYYLYETIGFLRFASGSGVPTLNRNDAHSFVSSVPRHTAEQQRIADCLTSLDDFIAVQTQKLGVLKTHKKGLMQQLFPSMEDA